MLHTTSIEVFACFRKACAPPPIGKGGTIKGRSASKAAPVAKKSAPTKKSAAVPAKGAPERMATASVEVRGAALKKAINESSNKGVMAMIKANGMNGTPKVVSQAAFDKLPSADKMARTAPKGANDRLLKGEKHELASGEANYGEGSYFARGKNGAEHVDLEYGRYGHTIIETYVNTSKLFDWKRISRINTAAYDLVEGGTPESVAKDWKVPESDMKLVKELAAVVKASGVKNDPENELLNDIGWVAATLGIPAYTVPHVKGREHDDMYVVVLDRSAMIVSTNPLVTL